MIDARICKDLGPLSAGHLCAICEKSEEYRLVLVERSVKLGDLDPRDIPLENADPGPFRRAGNFAAALIRHQADGNRQVPPEVYSERRRACDGCLYLDKSADTCRHKACGCNMEKGPIPGMTGKLHWASEECPRSPPQWRRWKPEPAQFPMRLDEKNCCVGDPGLRFNSSIIPWGGDGYLLAYRTGWAGSDIWLAKLDRNFRPHGRGVRLDLMHNDARYGREDPRLFMFRGKLHVMYIGVIADGPMYTNVLYARLSDELKVEAVFHPHYSRRNGSEKNWQFFEHDGELYAVYTINPQHRILRIRGGAAELIHETPAEFPWPHGEARGGAPPVLVGDEWYCFFHSRTGHENSTVYHAGLYTFENRPPFRVMRYIPDVLLSGDKSTKPKDQWASVVFPNGAVPWGPAWVLSCGIHDRWTELIALDGRDLEQRLLPVRPPPSFLIRDDVDAGMFRTVAQEDEYQLDGLDLRARDAVIDIGAHVGSFAHAAWRRGSRNVHCYEPLPDNFRILEHNAGGMQGVRCFREAVTDGRAAAHHPHASGNSNVGRFDPRLNGTAKPIFPAVSLDKAIDRAGGRAALVKLDCEGAEGLILAAADLSRIDRVCGECHPCFDCHADDVRRPLEAAGFTVTFGPERDGAMLFWALRPQAAP